MAEKLKIQGQEVPVIKVHTLVIGSGAAGLNAAVQLHARGVKDLLIITEGLGMGTSINTGSDKQTYYKLGLYGAEPDSPVELAKSFFAGGSMHGDLALVEAGLSARAFLNLVNLGVKFPQDRFGQFVGYKTDHDPRQRATSFGPYTSREMCRVLIDEIRRRNISVRENRVTVSLLTAGEGGAKRAAGAIAVHTENGENTFEAYAAENVVFAVGGPGGLYKTSVYPNVHTGAIGLALKAGVKAQSLPESQYGTASIKFRWNVSGTYMQVLPRMISTAADGVSDECEFLRPYFTTEGQMNTAVFLKGYQWPFDPRKVAGGSSIVDILVYIETALKGRRVFMDFRRNSSGLKFEELEPEALEYLKKSNALFGLPVERLRRMNPDAIKLYAEHGIDLVAEPLEIAVCAQHNNGGLAGNHWWESLNVKHLFPVGEVNGSHGVYRPGGSALNSGQVAGFRVADYISGRYMDFTLDDAAFLQAAQAGLDDCAAWLEKCAGSKYNWQPVRDEFQSRMTKAGSHIRSGKALEAALTEARTQYRQISEQGIAFSSAEEMVEAMRNLQLCFAQVVYLEALLAQVKSGVGSRGSAMVMDKNGMAAHPMLGDEWRFAPEDETFRDKVLETVACADGSVRHEWVRRRPLPECSAWFENAWADYREGRIFDSAEKGYKIMSSNMYDFSILRDLRKREHLNIADLSEKSGVSASVISKLERNQCMAELETIFRLAKVFGITASDLIALAENRTAHQCVATRHVSEGFTFSEITYKNIRCLHGKAPAGAKVSQPHLHRDDYELCWVLTGKLRFYLPNEKYELSAGDSIQFDALLAHTYEAVEKSEIIIIHLRKDNRF